jgi:hypothetical protein
VAGAMFSVSSAIWNFAIGAFFCRVFARLCWAGLGFFCAFVEKISPRGYLSVSDVLIMDCLRDSLGEVLLPSFERCVESFRVISQVS